MSDVNKQFLEALKLADAMLSGANMNASVVERKVKAAIAAAEQAQHGHDVRESVIGGIHLDMMNAGLHSDQEMANELERVLRHHLPESVFASNSSKSESQQGLNRTGEAQQAVPVARDVLISAMDSLREAIIDVYHESVGHSSLIEKKMRQIEISAIADRYAAHQPTVAVPDASDDLAEAMRKIVRLGDEHFEYGGSMVLRTANNCIVDMQEIANGALLAAAQKSGA